MTDDMILGLLIGFLAGWLACGVLAMATLFAHPRSRDRELYRAQQRALIRGRADKFPGYDGWGDRIDDSEWPA